MDLSHFTPSALLQCSMTSMVYFIFRYFKYAYHFILLMHIYNIEKETQYLIPSKIPFYAIIAV